MFRFLGVLLATGAMVVACGSTESDDNGQAPDASAGGTTGSGGNGNASGTGGQSGFGGQGGAGNQPVDAGADGGSKKEIERTCQGFVFACGDTLDNDGDGLVDAADPDCAGACDNAEDTFGSYFPVSPPPPCVRDCFYDRDFGPGNDACYYSWKCDSNMSPPKLNPRPNIPQCAYDPSTLIAGTTKSCSELKKEQPDPTCLSYCGPLTPNGCDCFGCCELPSGSGKWRYLGSTGSSDLDITCSFKVMSDPEKCRPCDPVPACLNKCDKCEVCIGGQKPGAGCSKAQQCPAGVQTCGAPGEAFCPKETYCVTGCCMPVAK